MQFSVHCNTMCVLL